MWDTSPSELSNPPSSRIQQNSHAKGDARFHGLNYMYWFRTVCIRKFLLWATSFASVIIIPALNPLFDCVLLPHLFSPHKGFRHWSRCKWDILSRGGALLPELRGWIGVAIHPETWFRTPVSAQPDLNSYQVCATVVIQQIRAVPIIPCQQGIALMKSSTAQQTFNQTMQHIRLPLGNRLLCSR